jgi:hypothetical protein
MIKCRIDNGDISIRPGWIRLSLHPVMSAEEIVYIADAIADIAINYTSYANDYVYHQASNTFTHKSEANSPELQVAHQWFLD